MISEERSTNHIAKQALSFPVGLLIRSPKRRLAKLGRKPSNGSLQSNTSDSTTRSVESSTGVRQPAKSKIRRHNNRLSTVFNRSPLLRDGGSRSLGGLGDRPASATDDPAELSSQMSAPGILKIFGSDICQGANYKSVLATTRSSAKELVKEALERYCLEKEDASEYVLCDVIGQTGGADHQWKTECFRVVGDHERPLMLQALWKPKQGLARRFEIQRRAAVEERSARDTDTVTAGLNAQVRKLTRGRHRVTSLFVDGSSEGSEADGPPIWRSLSDMDVSAMGQEARRTQLALGSSSGRGGDPYSTTSSSSAPTTPATPPGSPPGMAAPDSPEADSLRTEKEETESSDDNSTQYSIHPPFDFPYFLLLQGYNYRQDFVIYLLSGSSCVFGCWSEHRQGEDEERLKVDVLLFAPDVLPQHCRVRRQDANISEYSDSEGKHSSGGGGGVVTLLEPFQGAVVTHNGVPVKHEAALSPGDLVGLGQHYLFMFKDPTATAASQLPPNWVTWMSPAPGEEAPEGRGRAAWIVGTGGKNVSGGVGVGGRRRFGRPILVWRDLEGRELCLPYELPQEDRLLEEILAAVDPAAGGAEQPKLTPAFLLCLCIQHSAAHFKMANLRRLLLRLASQIQLAMWERTKELAVIQPDRSCAVEPEEPEEPEELEVRPLSMAQLVPGLQPLVLWMANSVELLHFIQHEVPLLLPWGQSSGTQQGEEEDQHSTGLNDSQILSTRVASEEAMTVLEEVIMFTFQQCVYYLTKSMYAVLPGLLDSNPFWESELRVPAGVSAVLEVLQGALQLLQAFQVHTQISSQLLAYLFFFTNASLFNTLMERGSGGGFYQWSRGVQIRANLDLLMDWIQGIGLADLAGEFFQKLSCAVNLLATPKENLLQASWSSLRAEFLHLTPAQLHHMLREYNPGRACPSSWSPTPEDADAALRTSDILESFDNHPPLILPSHTFHLELGKPVVDSGLFRQLQKMQEFLRNLPVTDPTISQTPDEHQCLTSPSTSESQTIPSIPSSPMSWSEAHRRRSAASTRDTPDSTQTRGSDSELSSCEAGLLTQKLESLALQSSLPGDASLGIHKSLALDPSCLLTPPNTPQSMEQAELEASLQEGAQHNARHRKAGAAEQRKMSREEEEDDEDEEEREEVFTVELKRGPHGLGLALVDGMKTPLKMTGIYIKSVVPDSPAARSQKLRLGDRILAVNGVSLVGIDYHTGRELIRTAGDSLRLLVAKTEARCSGRSSVTKC